MQHRMTESLMAFEHISISYIFAILSMTLLKSVIFTFES